MCQVKDLSYSSSTETKTLGLLWKPHPDSFAFKISPMTSNCDNLIVTKKSVISTIARVFDPLGLIGPVITNALESINCLDIPRYCLQDKSIRTELHGFSDSSEKAYGAALYLRCINTSGESIVLAWIKKPLAQLKTFVRNRVSIIQELTESDFWKHVNSENNPADILSRGISTDKIQHCELWWFGPPFLHQYKELEPYDITAVEDGLFQQELKETSDFPLYMCLINKL
ncbi:integrase catalytic domain-containing protein [Trichonephila clavipes]|nr:integrase catalytic domain-containing protein [Trichonephila clavipes]